MAEQPTTSQAPVIVDLGRVKKKRIRALKEGRGPLMAEIDEVVAAVEESLGEEAEGREILPVVIIYRKKRKRRRSLLDW